MKHEIIKGFTKFINENYSDESADNSISPKQHSSNLDRLRQLGIADGIATVYAGNSNEEMLRLTFSTSDEEVLISLDSLAEVVDIDDMSEEGEAAINSALWNRAEQLAKSHGCSILIDDETGSEHHIYEAANENANLNRLRQLGIADHEWQASMVIDFDYIYDGTPDGVKALFMEHAQNAGAVKINLESVDIDDWTDENTQTTDEDGETGINYGFQALIYFTFTTPLTDYHQIKESLESTFPNNVFMYVDELSRLDSNK